jgi:predicted transcriptional regulator
MFSHRPKTLSLGPLETEILDIIWQRQGATAKEIHDWILTDPDRELTYASVSTVLKRLVAKGWLARTKRDRAFVWQPRLSRREAQILQAHHQVKQLLAVGNPDIVAAFADELDSASIEQFQAMAARLQAARNHQTPPPAEVASAETSPAHLQEDL